jgi:hypothetical protein
MMLATLFSRENCVILFKAFAMSLFFAGTYKTFDLLMPKTNWTNAIMMVMASIIMLTWGDGSLSELYNLKPHLLAAAATASHHRQPDSSALQ